MSLATIQLPLATPQPGLSSSIRVCHCDPVEYPWTSEGLTKLHALPTPLRRLTLRLIKGRLLEEDTIGLDVYSKLMNEVPRDSWSTDIIVAQEINSRHPSRMHGETWME